MTHFNPIPKSVENPSSSRLDPEMQKAARKPTMPDGSLYDTSAVDYTGPSNWYVLTAVLVLVAGLLAVLYAFF